MVGKLMSLASGFVETAHFRCDESSNSSFTSRDFGGRLPPEFSTVCCSSSPTQFPATNRVNPGMPIILRNPSTSRKDISAACISCNNSSAEVHEYDVRKHPSLS
ncbi:hypothetical protein VTK73DRAFT_3294 [Phialemonium thermophilum]|uniref:Uncharacterized protein n=1 Tax=Phialemonium thermophilum TaxID=223376 RepID=A0ABR3Y100_9PEZI